MKEYIPAEPVSAPASTRKEVKEFRWIALITRLLDTAFPIPGTRYRFGLDPILGLLPGLGDAVSFGISGILVLAMVRHGVSRKVIILMIGNLIIDAVIGSIPLLGTIFDVGFKANKRNYLLLQKHYEEGKYQGSGTGILIGVALVLLLIFGLILFGVWQIARWILGYF
jgi:hypothetical protein